jgi:hypothetical protein
MFVSAENSVPLWSKRRVRRDALNLQRIGRHTQSPVPRLSTRVVFEHAFDRLGLVCVRTGGGACRQRTRHEPHAMPQRERASHSCDAVRCTGSGCTLSASRGRPALARLRRLPREQAPVFLNRQAFCRAPPSRL